MSLVMSIHPLILQKLGEIEPAASFKGRLPKIQSSDGGLYFCKIGSPAEALQYAGEAKSLEIMDAAAPGLVPKLLSFSTTESGEPVWISEYKDIAPLNNNAAILLAKRLATELHQKTNSEGFGFSIPTYCGATKLENGWFSTWAECYSAMIGDLLGQLEKKGRYQDLCQKGQQVRDMCV